MKQSLKCQLYPLVALCISFSSLWSQEDTLRQRYPLRIAVMDESISLPNHWFLRYSYNPAIMIGTSYLLRQRPHYNWHLAGDVGFYHHKDWQSAVFLRAAIGYQHNWKRFSGSARLGLGYAHIFHPAPVYKPDGNRLEQQSDFGSPAFMPSLALHFTFRLRDDESSSAIGLIVMQAADVPFNIFTSLHQMVGLSYTLYPFQKPTKS